MERAPVQPGHHHGPLLELTVHISCGESGCASPEGEPRSAQILRLNSQQPVGDLDHSASWRPDQLLSGRPAAVALAHYGGHSRYSHHDRDPNQGPTLGLAPSRPSDVVRVSNGAQVRLIPPVVYLLPFALMGALQRWRPWTIPGGAALRVAGLALVVSGIALMLWSFVTLMAAQTTVIPWEQVSSVVVTGPFRLSRNPIYLADAITYLGGTLLISSWWPFLVLPGIVLVVRRRIIDREERYLHERFGERYRLYQLRVRRWL
jgi:protein-S-isoprenylcysteine O-methyltransferase Ste14